MKLFKENDPTLVIIDYRMPIKSGIIGVKELRKIDDKVPIIVLTIDESQEVADKFLKLGANDFAVKPIKAPDLISRINLHLQLIKSNFKSPFSIEDIKPLDKGISENTLKILLKSLKDSKEYLTVEQISELSGLSNQTTYRYLQFLDERNILKIKVEHGKIGRPKQFYKLKD